MGFSESRQSCGNICLYCFLRGLHVLKKHSTVKYLNDSKIYGAEFSPVSSLPSVGDERLESHTVVCLQTGPKWRTGPSPTCHRVHLLAFSLAPVYFEDPRVPIQIDLYQFETMV